MHIYIALLRGINVGGKKIIKMADLKKLFEALGLCNVQTYIQSGNVLFKSKENEEVLRKKIEEEIELAFGYSVAVVLRAAEELEKIINKCPFTEEEMTKATALSKSESLYVALLGNLPLQEDIHSLDKYKTDNEEYEVIDKEVFLLFRNSIRNSKLANNLQKLNVPITVRNWKTINKLHLLAKTMNE